MREIKFRVWHKEWQQMIYLTDGSPIDNYSLIITADDVMLEFDNTEDEKKYFYKSQDEIIPLQFTGLKDCKGREIYEGDIVRWIISPFQKWKVSWLENICGFNPFCDYDVDCDGYPDEKDSKNYEVIGNVWENKELLNDNK